MVESLLQAYLEAQESNFNNYVTLPQINTHHKTSSLNARKLIGKPYNVSMPSTKGTLGSTSCKQEHIIALSA